ncbi:MAG: hypothetical protein Q8L35_09185 [Actinomycetota bacterium]|nr:hypothetical protein [Actinomycetota bacterium]
MRRIPSVDKVLGAPEVAGAVEGLPRSKKARL